MLDNNRLSTMRTELLYSYSNYYNFSASAFIPF